MVTLLTPHLDHKGKRGRQIKLSVPDELLIALEYWREERTYFYIAQSWGIDQYGSVSDREQFLRCWKPYSFIDLCALIEKRINYIP